MPRCRFLVWFALAAACSPGTGSLTVQLASDMTPDIELDRARVTLVAEDGTPMTSPVDVPLAAGRSLGRPVRLAVFDALARGEYTLLLEIERAHTVVQTRTLRVRVEGDVLRTLLVTRDCGGVSCPSAGDPSALACLGGRCVDPHCSPEDPTACGTPVCTIDGDCAQSAVACAPSRCIAGTCVVVPDDGACPSGGACDPLAGCRAPTPACDWSDGPALTAPVVLLDTAVAESGLSLSRDGLDLFFSEELGTSAMVLTAHRSALDAPFGAPRALSELHTPGELESSFAFRRDDLEVIFTSQTPGGAMPGSNVFARTRARASDPWGPPVLLDALSSPLDEYDTWLEPDGLTLWLERQTSSEADVFRARRARFDLPFAAPVPVAGLSVAGRVEANPTLPDDASFVVVTTDGTARDRDLAYAHVVDGAIGDLVPVPVVNGPDDEGEPLIRADGCELLFVSHRAGMGGAAIYQSTVAR